MKVPSIMDFNLFWQKNVNEFVLFFWNGSDVQVKKGWCLTFLNVKIVEKDVFFS